MKCERCGSVDVDEYKHESDCGSSEWCVCNVCGATSPDIWFSIDTDLKELCESQFDTEGE